MIANGVLFLSLLYFLNTGILTVPDTLLLITAGALASILFSFFDVLGSALAKALLGGDE